MVVNIQFKIKLLIHKRFVLLLLFFAETVVKLLHCKLFCVCFCLCRSTTQRQKADQYS